MRPDDDIKKSEEPASPCIGVCHLDLNTALCVGCARSVGEIQTWPYLDAASKQQILDQLPERRGEVLP